MDSVPVTTVFHISIYRMAAGGEMGALRVTHLLAHAVKSRGRLVQKQDHRVLDDSSSNCDPLSA